MARPKDKRMSIILPEYFFNSIRSEAKKMGLTITDYATAILIQEMRNGTVKKDIEERIARGNMFWLMFPHQKEIYQGSPVETELAKRAYKIVKKKKVTT